MVKAHESLNKKFLQLADAVSFGMGTPSNIIFWILAVVIWFALGVTRRELFANGTFLPDWFTSPSWNFPLNTITTLAELYIGFLVAAAANRSERKLRGLIENMKYTIEKVERINDQQNQILQILLDNQKKELSEDRKILHELHEIQPSENKS